MMDIPKINYQGHKTLKQAEAERARTTTPRVDEVANRFNVRYSYQFAVEMTELAKTLELELAKQKAPRHPARNLWAEHAARARERQVGVSQEPATGLEALSNDEVYERLKQYRCFGMTTRDAALSHTPPSATHK